MSYKPTILACQNVSSATNVLYVFSVFRPLKGKFQDGFCGQQNLRRDRPGFQSLNEHGCEQNG
jgi:hypothetical protein